MKNKSSKKMVINFALFILLLIVTLWILLRNQDTSGIFNIILHSNGLFIAIGILAMFIYISLEALNIGRTLKLLGNKTSFLKNLKYALIGSFFSGITPAASGGQPMQIYYMRKDGILVSHSTLTLLINLTSMQISTISIAIISVLFNYQYLNTMLVILLILGLLLNIIALSILLASIFSRRLSKWFMKVLIRIMKFFKFINMDKKIKKFGKELKTYQKSSKYIKKHKKIILKILLTTFVQFLIYYSVAYWTYRALGLNGHNIIEIITMQSVLFATVSGLPLPGSVGISEGIFVELFIKYYPGNMIRSATLLNRGISFYIFMIISGIVVVINQKKKKKNEEDL